MESPFLPSSTQEEASLTSTLSAKHTDRMGSGCSGERQGQEITSGYHGKPAISDFAGTGKLGW